MAAKPRIINTANKNRKNQKKSNNSNKKKKEEMKFQSEEDLYSRIRFGINFAGDDKEEKEQEQEDKQIEIEDYIKENKKKKKKKSKIKRLFITIIIVVLLILISRLGIFSIKNIEVEGNSFLPTEKVVEISGVNQGENIFDIGRWRTIDNLEANPYIEEANIDKKLPSTLVLKIVERQPEFIIANEERVAYISKQGYVLEIVEENALSLPKLLGLNAALETVSVGNRLEEEDLKKLNKILNVYEYAKRYEVSNFITAIDVSNDDNFTLVMDGEGKKVYLGDCSDLNTRMLELQVILRREQGHHGEVFLNVDLNTQRAYFREST
jgi:cell division protein FtsQ